MANHGTATILGPLWRLKENFTETADLHEISEFIELNSPLTLALSTRIRFGIIASLMLLIVLLSLIRLVQAFLDQDFRVVERNQSGYFNGKAEVLEPFFAILNSVACICSLVSLVHDNGQYLSRFTSTSQILSHIFLFFWAVTTVWNTFSVTPTVLVQLTPFRKSLSFSGLPPYLFNALVTLVYISFPAATLPLALKASNQNVKLGEETFEFLPDATVLVTHYQNAHPGQFIASPLMKEAMITLRSKKHLQEEWIFLSRVICAIYAIFWSSLLIVFNYASTRLCSSLTTQIRILGQARRRFARMASVGMRSLDSETSFSRSKPVQPLIHCDKVLQSIKKHKKSIWTYFQDQPETLQLWDSLDSCPENVQLSKKFYMSMRYRKVVWWQWLCTNLTFLTFLILSICLAADVFSSHGVPRANATWLIQEWTGWAWALPGSAFTLLACCLQFMPHSYFVTEPNALQRNSTHKQAAGEHHNQLDSSPRSNETNVVKIRCYASFLFEVAPSPSKETIFGNIISSERKIWRKLQPSKPNPTLKESQTLQKSVALSLSQDEMAHEKSLNPKDGYHVRNGPSGAQHGTSFVKGSLSLNYVGSDVDIIRSLRAYDV